MNMSALNHPAWGLTKLQLPVKVVVSVAGYAEAISVIVAVA
jgi:hypothetical protein